MLVQYAVGQRLECQGRPGSESDLQRHREKGEGSDWTQLARDTKKQSWIMSFHRKSHLGTEWFVTVVAILGCQLDTLGRGKPQLRNCLLC